MGHLYLLRYHFIGVQWSWHMRGGIAFFLLFWSFLEVLLPHYFLLCIFLPSFLHFWPIFCTFCLLFCYHIFYSKCGLIHLVNTAYLKIWWSMQKVVFIFQKNSKFIKTLTITELNDCPSLLMTSLTSTWRIIYLYYFFVCKDLKALHLLRTRKSS